MTDRYYMKIKKSIDDTKYKLQFAAMTLNLKNNENNISSNLNKIKNNENEIITIKDIDLSKINTNVSTNLEKIYTIENDIINIFPSLKIFDKKYNIKNQSFNFNRNTCYFNILETEIENKFSKFGILNIKSNIYYKYDDLKNDMYRSCHKYRFYDDRDTLFYEIVLNKYNFGITNFDNNIFHINDNFYVKLKGDYNEIKIIILLARIYPFGSVEYNLKHINDNFINTIYLDKSDITLKIDKNENDLKTNVSDISNNSKEINLIKENIPSNKQYLKNVYNELFRDQKTQIAFSDNKYFYEKVFNDNYVINDFIEINAKFILEINDISNVNYVKIRYLMKIIIGYISNRLIYMIIDIFQIK